MRHGEILDESFPIGAMCIPFEPFGI